MFIFGVLVYAVIAGFSGLRLSLAAVRSADTSYVLAAGATVGLSFLWAALTYKLLSPKIIPYLPTLLVQVSGGLVNRLLPAGLGGLGINLLYLKKKGNSMAAATAIVATNNILGLVGNILLVLMALVVFPVPRPDIALPDLNIALMAAIIIVLLIAVLLLRRRTLAGKVRASLTEMVGFVVGLVHRPLRSAAALLSSCAVTASHALAMYLVLMAIDVRLPWPAALLAISAGALASAVIPTPGGLGGAEAGIAAVLLTFEVPPATSVAAALIYRGLTYWLPLLPGYLALRVAEKRYLY
jgi:uncharacterized membrane protein YbhN (UPF0104 family)